MAVNLCTDNGGLSVCDKDSRDDWDKQRKCDFSPTPPVNRGWHGKRCLYQREDGTCFCEQAQRKLHSNP